MGHGGCARAHRSGVGAGQVRVQRAQPRHHIPVRMRQIEMQVLQTEVSSEPFSTFDVTNTVLAQVGFSFIF